MVQKIMISSHIYQIYSYVKNLDVIQTECVEGLALYAKTDEDIVPDETYMMAGNRISLKCIVFKPEVVWYCKTIRRYCESFYKEC